MEPDDELTDDAPLVPHLGRDPDRTDPGRIESSRTDPGRNDADSGPVDVDALRREVRALRTRLDRVEAALADQPTDDSGQ